MDDGLPKQEFLLMVRGFLGSEVAAKIAEQLEGMSPDDAVADPSDELYKALKSVFGESLEKARATPQVPYYDPTLSYEGS